MNDTTSAYPDDNPKTIHGIKKVPLHLVPPSASHALALGFADGAAKYGPYNWREKTVSASIYVAAAKRHIDAWFDGEEVASDSQVPHLAHAMACLAIIYDGMTIDKINDDRPPAGASPRLQKEYAEKKIKEENAKQRITDARETGLVQEADRAALQERRRWRERIEQVRQEWGIVPGATLGSAMDGPDYSMEHGGVSDLQADLQSGYVTKLLLGDSTGEYWYTSDGGVERYDPAGNRLMQGTAVGRLHT